MMPSENSDSISTLRGVFESLIGASDLWEIGVCDEEWSFVYARSAEEVEIRTSQGVVITVPALEVRAYPREGIELHSGGVVLARRYFPEDLGFKERRFVGSHPIRKALRWNPSPPKEPCPSDPWPPGPPW